MGQGLHPRDAQTTLKVGRIISETGALRLREGGAGPGQQRVTLGLRGEPLAACCPDGLLTARCSCTPAPGQAAGWPLCTSVSMGRGGNGGTERAGSISPRHTCTDMLLLLSWWLSVFPRGGQSWGSETQDLAPSALGRGWGARGPLSSCPVSGSPDLEDMSVMILRTQGPDALFDDHKLVLHTSSADAERARVFHACGELMPVLPCPGGGGCSVSPPRLGCRLCSGSGAALRAQRKKHQMREFHDWLPGVPGTAVPKMVLADECIFKHILSTFKNFDYQNFQAYPEAEHCEEPVYANHSDSTRIAILLLLLDLSFLVC